MACECIWFDYQKEDISGDNIPTNHNNSNTSILSCDILPT